MLKQSEAFFHTNLLLSFLIFLFGNDTQEFLAYIFSFLTLSMQSSTAIRPGTLAYIVF